MTRFREAGFIALMIIYGGGVAASTFMLTASNSTASPAVDPVDCRSSYPTGNITSHGILTGRVLDRAPVRVLPSSWAPDWARYDVSTWGPRLGWARVYENTTMWATNDRDAWFMENATRTGDVLLISYDDVTLTCGGMYRIVANATFPLEATA